MGIERSAQHEAMDNSLFDSLRPPDVPLDVIQQSAAALYGLSGSWSRLAGERDLNLLVKDGEGVRWLLRVCNDREGTAIFDSQVRALQHIARTDASLPVPRVRATLDGQPLGRLTFGERVYPAILLSFLPGGPVGTTRLTVPQLRDVGTLVARLGKALRGFYHGAPGARELVWDHRSLPALSAHVDLLPSGQRARALSILDSFTRDTLPVLETLRRQIIHGDAHPDNVLIDEGRISGVIDFGDMMVGTLAQDLSNTIADFILPGADNIEIIGEIVRGYNSVTQLEEEEIDILLPLLRSRLLMTPLVLALRERNGVAETAYADNAVRAFPLLDELAAREDAVSNAIRRAAAFPPKSTRAIASVDDMLARRRRLMGNNLYMFYDTPLYLARGEGVWLTAVDGRRYLDCYNNVPHVGHCHPYVTEAIHRQSRILNTNTRYLSNQALDYAERLVATLDPSLTAVAFVNSGSEANDVAWRMAKAWTGRSGGLAMEYAYHGITDAIDPFSPSNDLAAWNFPHMRTLPAPDDYRGPIRRGERDLARRYADLADRPIAELEEAGYGVAAGMVDSAFRTNGMLEAPAGYLSRVVDKIRAAGGLFIADEVQSGFGRMGSALWGHQHHGVVPDFVTLGKPAGNGHPIGVVITRPEILDHFTRTATFFSTFGGNNVSCAAGLAVIDVIRDEQLVENAKSTGAYFKSRLAGLKDRHALIGDVRGTGLALGVELVLDRQTLEPARTETRRLANMMRDRGVLIGTEGVLGNILKLRPPVVFKPEHVDVVIDALNGALTELSGTP